MGELIKLSFMPVHHKSFKQSKCMPIKNATPCVLTVVGTRGALEGCRRVLKAQELSLERFQMLTCLI